MAWNASPASAKTKIFNSWWFKADKKQQIFTAESERAGAWQMRLINSLVAHWLINYLIASALPTRSDFTYCVRAVWVVLPGALRLLSGGWQMRPQLPIKEPLTVTSPLTNPSHQPSYLHSGLWPTSKTCMTTHARTHTAMPKRSSDQLISPSTVIYPRRLQPSAPAF